MEAQIDVDRRTTAVQRAGGVLQHVPFAHGLAVGVLQGAGALRRSCQVGRYLRDVPAEQRRLVVGCGAMSLDGWLCTDLVPVRPSIVYLDATKPWPMPRAAFRFVVCEHVIEHVPYEGGRAMLGEAHRVLGRDGVLRISTPNLDVVRRLPDSDDPDVLEYVRWSNQTFGSPSERAEAASPVHTVNRMMRAWGHTYLYDEATLRHSLAQAGFRSIVRCEPGRSEHRELSGVDRHATLIGEMPNRVESLILEATA